MQDDANGIRARRKPDLTQVCEYQMNRIESVPHKQNKTLIHIAVRDKLVKVT